MKDAWYRLTGACLALTTFLTFFFWWHQPPLAFYAPDAAMPICHGFFPACDTVTFGAPVAFALLGLLAVLPILSVIGFARAEWTRFGVGFLAAASLLRLALFLGRFNIMGNYHLVPFLLLIAFFFFRPVRGAYRLFLVLIYVLAGLLKLGSEWMSGAALVTRPWLEGKWLALALAYVPVMELAVVWGLLARAKWLRALTLIQLLAFHVFSWHVVGFFYPTTMFLVLIPCLAELHPAFEEPPGERMFAKPMIAFATLVLVFHLWPWLRGFDPSLEGRFRGLRINMLDARADCRAVADIQEPGRQTYLSFLQPRAPRTRCDPSVFESQLRRVCSALTESQRLHFVFYTKRTTDAEYTKLRSTADFCQGSADVQNF